MTSTPLDKIEEFDCVLIATDHSSDDYSDIVKRARLVDSRNATAGLSTDNIVRC